MEKKTRIIIDRAIDYYNENNPDKEKLTRKSLQAKMETGMTINTLQNYKKGMIPRGFDILIEVKRITGFLIDGMIDDCEQ